MVKYPVPSELPRFGERLDWAIRNSKRVKSKSDLAARLESSPSYVSRLLGREDQPGKDALRNLSEILGVPESWLAYGVAPNGNGEAVQTVGDEGGAPEGYVALPRYDVKAAAGVAVPVISEEVVDWVYFKADWLRRALGLNPQHLALVQATGDSMSPTIDDGDLLMVDYAEPILRGPGLYVLASDDAPDGLMVKRVQLTPTGLLVTSDNDRYQPYSISADDSARVRIIGRVVWTGGRV